MCKTCRVITVEATLTHGLAAVRRAVERLGGKIVRVQWLQENVTPHWVEVTLPEIRGSQWVQFAEDGRVSLNADSDYTRESQLTTLQQRMTVEDNILAAEAAGYTVVGEELREDGSIELLVETGAEVYA